MTPSSYALATQHKTQVERLAEFVVRSRYEDMPLHTRFALKAHVLDALGCAIGALDAEPVRRLRRQIDLFGGQPLTTFIGGGRSSPDRVALYNAALVRYLDFNDAFLAPGETCHPSDNVGPVLAASEFAAGSGKDFLAALAVAYQVQCRLSQVAPVRARGFDHTTQGAYAVAAGAARALGLDAAQTAQAIAMSGTANNALRVTRTGELSHWKGLAYPFMAFAATNAAFLAREGITGPREVFEGNKGFVETIAGPYLIDWGREGLDVVTQAILKRYNAEIHSQSALEGILQLQARYHLSPEDIDWVRVEIFDVGFNIIGGGEEGDKRLVRTKEEADHSLPYLLAVALLDGEVTPAQYTPERIQRDDTQRLLRKISVRPTWRLSERFPKLMPCRIEISLRDGRTVEIQRDDYEGFLTRPMPWGHVVEKFNQLAAPYAERTLRDEIVEAVANLEHIPVAELVRRLEHVGQHSATRDATGSAATRAETAAPAASKRQTAPRSELTAGKTAIRTRKATAASKKERES
ncbi:MAG TPA: MmgE/PrpD family protein [Ktedonobacterales bacterium]